MNASSISIRAALTELRRLLTYDLRYTWLSPVKFWFMRTFNISTLSLMLDCEELKTSVDPAPGMGFEANDPPMFALV